MTTETRNARDLKDVIVYADYQIDELPKQSSNTIRLICISDSHNVQGEQPIVVPPGDVLLHSGDLTYRGSLEELKETYDWIASLPHPHKVIICGNHDFAFDAMFDANKSSWFRYHGRGLPRPKFEGAELQRWIDSDDFYFLLDSECIIDVKGERLKFYGSPWTPKFGGTSFAYSITHELALRKQRESKYDRIPNDVDVLLTHGPAYMILDETFRGEHPGCPVLRNVLEEEIRPFLMVHGHIHEAAGNFCLYRKDGTRTQIVNAAVLNTRYQVVNKPVIVDVTFK